MAEKVAFAMDVEVFKGMAGRDAYGQALLKVGEEDERVVVLAADALNSTRGNLFLDKFPNRAFNFGISEPNMISAASGLAMMGKIPVVAGYGFLLGVKCAEQVRVDLCYANRNVKLACTATGFAMAAGGVTHHCTEDVPILRNFANMTIVQPASAIETALATRAAILDHEGPVYLRLTRDQMFGGGGDEIYEAGKVKFQLGKGVTVNEGSDVTIVSSGQLVGMALAAAQDLAKEGINARVINIHTIKPIDEDIILKAAAETRGVITVEDCNVSGGLGAAVAGVICKEKQPVTVQMIGVPDDKFGPIGPSQEAIWEYFGITKEAVMEKAKSIMA
jgi:transketolase